MPANIRKMLIAAVMIGAAPPAFADVITDWNEKAIAFVTPRMPPPAAQRAVAMVQIAMFDAVNSIERRYRPYLIQLPAAPTASTSLFSDLQNWRAMRRQASPSFRTPSTGWSN